MDDKQMKQVVQNLMSNAREAMPDGGVVYIRAHNIEMSAKDNLPLKEGKYVKWSVEDHGIGITKENREKLFEPYFTTKQKGETKGIGLGLAICYSIVKKHDGFITVYSEPQTGTTVDVYLPAALTESHLDKDSSGPSPADKKRILVMDPDEVMRDIMGIMLNFLGYASEFARDGEEAIRLYERAVDAEQPFAAVILDSTLSGSKSVEEILQKLIGMEPHVKAIIAGGDPDHPVMSEFRMYGFSAAVTKPYSIDTLKIVLNNLQL
jgi:two-component system cell cycle sensor histidine kinase/response regulator CckA